MKRICLYILISVMGIVEASAEHVMTVNARNQQAQQLAVDEIVSIRYSDGNMIVTLKEGNTVTWPLTDVEIVTFSSMTAAINTLSEGQGTVPYAIYSLDGRLLERGATDDADKVANRISEPGNYVINVNGVFRKIRVGRL